MEEGPLGPVRVNFDPALVSLLRETRYFQLMAAELPSGIPATALKVHSIADLTLLFQ